MEFEALAAQAFQDLAEKMNAGQLDRVKARAQEIAQRNNARYHWRTNKVEFADVHDAAREVRREDNPARLEAGQILCSKWGHEQTNVEFFQVTRLTKTQAIIQQIEAQRIAGSDAQLMTYVVIPAPEKPIGEPIRRKIGKDFEGFPMIAIEPYQLAYIWDGKPKHGTEYA